jgi:hypothetical protein
MCKIPLRRWIANAAARFSGNHGAVTHQARDATCSRQTVYDHAAKVQAALQAEHAGGPSRDQLIQQNQALREENARLWAWLELTIEFPPAKQQEFAARAWAMGLSLTQISILLALLLGAQAAPARSTIHRWVRAAGIAAGKVLRGLDARCKALVLVGCLDEIFFHGRPVLVGVEPASMVWFLGTKAEALRASTWVEPIRAWDTLGYVVADAGVILQAAIVQVQEQRRGDGQPPLTRGLDVFHTQREAQRVLKIIWNQVERDWEDFERAEQQVPKVQRQGIPAHAAAGRARAARVKLTRSMGRYDAARDAWKLAESALQVFRPDGTLNDRAWAEAQIQRALPELSGRAWKTLRHHLQAPEMLTFLDRLHEQLARIPVSQELRQALVHLWWLRRQRPRKTTEGMVGGSGHVAHLVQQELCRKLDPNWRGWYLQVAAVLRGTVRASSAVECMNSVLRMHQSRHRTLNQGMLDLKRLYWNCREFRGGKRKGKCPYEHLGLDLPSSDFWELLQAEMPAALEEAKVTAKPTGQAKAA